MDTFDVKARLKSAVVGDTEFGPRSRHRASVAGGRRETQIDEFAFKEADTKIIKRLIHTLSRVSQALMLLASVRVISGLVNLSHIQFNLWRFKFDLGDFDPAKLSLFSDALTSGIIGFYLKKASVVLGKITDSPGHDIRNLLLGLEELDRAFTKQLNPYYFQTAFGVIGLSAATYKIVSSFE